MGCLAKMVNISNYFGTPTLAPSPIVACWVGVGAGAVMDRPIKVGVVWGLVNISRGRIHGNSRMSKIFLISSIIYDYLNDSGATTFEYSERDDLAITGNTILIVILFFVFLALLFAVRKFEGKCKRKGTKVNIEKKNIIEMDTVEQV